MDRRYEQLRELPNDVCPEGKLTPAIARNRALNMPLVLVCVDEVQRYLEHPELGQTITELLTELVKVGPAVGIMLDLATQRPDAKTLPEGLRGPDWDPLKKGGRDASQSRQPKAPQNAAQPSIDKVIEVAPEVAART
jgi:hypothetical protein